MQISEAINRGKNLLTASFLGIAGLAFLPEVFLEQEKPFKVDDGILLILGIIAVWWYNKGQNKFKRSVLPVVLVILALLDKIMGIILEFKEKDDVGDDFGALILFVALAILVIWQYRKKEEA